MIRAFLLTLALAASLPAAKTLDVYFVDVEGGQATLMVAPSGESLMVDAGWPGFDGRDADRIAAVAKQAGLKKIDYFVASHYHRDHIGGVEALITRIPIAHYVDHGPSVESGGAADQLFASYTAARDQGKHLVVKPGDKIPIKGLNVTVVSAAGELLKKPLKGGGAANPLCSSAVRRDEDKTENARSVGILVEYGKFRIIDLGDLTWNKEIDLMCPNNPIGTIDVYLTTHHGMNMSGPDTIVHALHPRVAIMNNGAKKGGTPEAWQVVKKSPGLEDLWQVHYALAGGAANNVAEPMIANMEEKCEGKGIKLSAGSDGGFTVTNLRNGHSKTYAARK